MLAHDNVDRDCGRGQARGRLVGIKFDEPLRCGVAEDRGGGKQSARCPVRANDAIVTSKRKAG
jgi:hypothetical protein